MNDDRKRRTMEVLDVEDEESRQKRIRKRITGARAVRRQLANVEHQRL